MVVAAVGAGGAAAAQAKFFQEGGNSDVTFFREGGNNDVIFVREGGKSEVIFFREGVNSDVIAVMMSSSLEADSSNIDLDVVTFDLSVSWWWLKHWLFFGPSANMSAPKANLFPLIPFISASPENEYFMGLEYVLVRCDSLPGSFFYQPAAAKRARHFKVCLVAEGLEESISIQCPFLEETVTPLVLLHQG